MENYPKMIISGEECDAVSGETMDVYNPATGDWLATVPMGGSADIDKASKAAEQASHDWRYLGFRERSNLLKRLSDVISDQAEKIALMDAKDSGNPLVEMRKDVHKAAAHVEYMTGLALEVKGETIPATTPNNIHMTLREPFGVVGRIMPFNHPAMFTIQHLVSPLVTGNTVILKPSEATPLSALYIVKLAQDILPAGVLNVVTGAGNAGSALVEDPRVRRLSFTGGPATGQKIMQGASGSGVLKHVTLELGGKNPMIVFPDVDEQKAADAVLAGMNFKRCLGQSCGSTSRVFIHKSKRKAVIDKVVASLQDMKPGNPSDENTEMGSLTSKRQYDKTVHYVNVAKQEGARLLHGGDTYAEESLNNGYFFKPTVFDEVTTDMTIAQEEVFGPVVSFIEWDDYDEMIKAVNSVAYGLTASIWTNDMNTILKTVPLVEAGFIWVNDVEKRYHGVPFGGTKDSGIGREHCLDELLSYTQLKSVNMLAN